RGGRFVRLTQRIGDAHGPRLGKARRQRTSPRFSLRGRHNRRRPSQSPSAYAFDREENRNADGLTLIRTAPRRFAKNSRLNFSFSILPSVAFVNLFGFLLPPIQKTCSPFRLQIPSACFSTIFY